MCMKSLPFLVVELLKLRPHQIVFCIDPTDSTAKLVWLGEQPRSFLVWGTQTRKVLQVIPQLPNDPFKLYL